MSRLSQTDWIAAGFRALTQSGPHALKAEPLARSLGTTKGSFYWHFKDVPDFQTAMLALWEDQATEQFISQLDDISGPEQKLRSLCVLIDTSDDPYGGVGVEPAIRAWAKADAAVQTAVARVDALRLEFLAKLFRDMGLANPTLAPVFYACLIGLDELALGGNADRAHALDTQADMIIALSQLD